MRTITFESHRSAGALWALARDRRTVVLDREAIGQVPIPDEMWVGLTWRNGTHFDEALAQIGANDLQVLRIFTGGDAVAPALLRLSGLREIALLCGCSDNTLAAVAELVRLESLWIESRTVTDKGLAYLERCTSVEHLVLSSPGISSEGVERVIRCMPKLYAVQLDGGAALDDTLLHALARDLPPLLEAVVLRHCPAITRGGVSQLLSAHPKLKVSLANPLDFPPGDACGVSWT